MATLAAASAVSAALERFTTRVASSRTETAAANERPVRPVTPSSRFVTSASVFEVWRSASGRGISGLVPRSGIGGGKDVPWTELSSSPSASVKGATTATASNSRKSSIGMGLCSPNPCASSAPASATIVW